MPTATVESYVENAKLIARQADKMYLALGKTSPWVNENMPEVPDSSDTDLEELIGFKELNTVSLCRKIRDGESPSNPTVRYMGDTWVLVPEEDAQDEEAYHVYFSCTIEPDDMPLGEYRQVGIYTNIDSDKSIIEPEDGDLNDRVLYFYDNRQQFNRTEQVSVTESFIINTSGVS